MESISVDKILERSSCLDKSNPEDKYNKSYYYFLAYFSHKRELTEQDLVLAANFTYGWMPTILNFKSDDFSGSVSILNQSRGEKRIADKQLITLKSLINNSLVGASKLLHFVNPDVYAIWDSRVCKFLTGKSHQQKVEKIALYWSYLDLCSRVAADCRFQEVHSNHKERVGFEFSPMRTIEQIIFISSNKPLQS